MFSAITQSRFTIDLIEGAFSEGANVEAKVSAVHALCFSYEETCIKPTHLLASPCHITHVLSISIQRHISFSQRRALCIILGIGVHAGIIQVQSSHFLGAFYATT